MAEILAADRTRTDAMVHASRPALEATLHASLTYTHSNGKLDTKASLIERLTGGGVDYRKIEYRKSNYGKSESRKSEPAGPLVRVRGKTAIVNANVQMQVEASGQIHELEMVYTAVYFLEDGRWQLAAYQSVRDGS